MIQVSVFTGSRDGLEKYLSHLEENKCTVISVQITKPGDAIELMGNNQYFITVRDKK